ncbi:OmpA family protein [uncultured Sphingomonas sp.]|uniref:OmpA/MotB family protein n=1 Tax=uncultured Sphingomonas sp. TaxID=158754 RepID=UPI00260274E6|nr:OmpA family protein [uncultured Sphingomonas sp.]
MIAEHADETEVVEEENYFVSMTDMMVGLVFVFIILLMYFALQFRDVTEELSGADRTRAQILKQLQQSLHEKGVEVSIDTQNGVLRLPDSILFDSARAELKPEGHAAVGHLAEALRDVLPCYVDGGAPRAPTCPKTNHRIESIYVEGHTDADRYAGSGALKDNWDLSVVRATNTYRALTEIKPELGALCVDKGPRCEPVLNVSGYGPQRPVSMGPANDEATKRLNRRIDVRLIMVTPDAGASVEALRDRLDKR